MFESMKPLSLYVNCLVFPKQATIVSDILNSEYMHKMFPAIKNIILGDTRLCVDF